MKTLLSIAATLMFAVMAQAQFLSPSQFQAITNSGNWLITPAAGGSPATNVALAQAPWVPVGGVGFGVAIKSFATNAALTTNVWFTLEFSADGVNAITNNNVTVVLLPRGVATNTYYTNFVLNTSATIGQVASVRIKDVMQTNGLIGSSLAGNLFVEKFLINTR